VARILLADDQRDLLEALRILLKSQGYQTATSHLARRHFSRPGKERVPWWDSLSSFTGWLLKQIVYQANPRDCLILIGVVLTMSLVGVAASAIPALRAVTWIRLDSLGED